MFASNLQIFTGTKAFQENVSTNEINVQVLYDNGNLNNITMECTFNDKLEELRDEIKSFGDIKVDNSDKHTSFSWKGDTSAQLYQSISEVKTIENINVRLVRKINIDGNGLSGCAILEDGNMLFIEAHKNNLLKYGPDGNFLSELHIKATLPGSMDIGYDLAVVDSNTVAVSSGGNDPREIRLIDTNSGQTCQVFSLDDFCYGLSYHNGSLIYSTYKEGIYLSNLINKSLTNVRKVPNTPKCVFHTYVTFDESNIFYSNYHDHSVVCYDFNGQVKWKYSDSLLKIPYGITLDSYSNIYVAGFESNNVVVISPDGKQAKELIGASDGLRNPRAIHFEKNKNLLLVVNCDKVAFIYNV